MIITDKWIFVHTPKTGGNSVAKALGGHTPANKIAPHAPLWIVNKGDRFAFGFVRDPWERVVSFYRFLQQKEFRSVYNQEINHDRERIRALGFKRWLMEDEFHMWRDRDWRAEWPERFKPMQRRPQMSWLEGCDFVGRFERLADDFAKACRLAGIAKVPRLPHLNATTGGDWRAEHDADTIAFVAEHFAPDIERFGYKAPTKIGGTRYNH